MARRAAVVALALALALVVGCAHPRPSRYAVPADLGTLVTDADAFARFAADVRPALVRAADTHDDRDAAFTLAVLDALDGAWPASVARIDALRATTSDPRAALMTGLTIRVWAAAIADGADDPDGFRRALDPALDALPLDTVRPDLAMLRTMAQVFTPAVCRQLVEESVGPTVRDGTVDLAAVHAVVFQRYAVVRLVPVGAIVDAALDARGIEPVGP